MEKSKKYIKYCFVPSCKSSNFSTPDTEFLCIPEKTDTRKSLCGAVGRKPEKTPKKAYCCEDHFNVGFNLLFLLFTYIQNTSKLFLFYLEEDLENYHIYKSAGGNKRLKLGVVPHLNIFPSDTSILQNFSNAQSSPKYQNLTDNNDNQETDVSFENINCFNASASLSSYYESSNDSCKFLD